MSEEEFEELFGNIPINNIKKIKEYINRNFVNKSKIRKLRDIDNIDLIQYRLKELLEE